MEESAIASVAIDDVEYEEMDHTGDLALLTKASNPQALIGSCLLALTRLVVDDSPIRSEDVLELEARGPDREERLVRLMQDYLYACLVEKFLACHAQVEEHPADNWVRVRLTGEQFNPQRHEIIREIKAVTYHGLRFGQTPKGEWEAYIICDI